MILKVILETILEAIPEMILEAVLEMTLEVDQLFSKQLMVIEAVGSGLGNIKSERCRECWKGITSSATSKWRR